MALSPGTRLGHYDVTALLGEGGMGQVWQATDTQLNRQVALKILPDAFAADPDRLARFTREAQILASLNHPNIAAIYGIEEAEGTRALVLELVEGPTLADRISKGPIPLDEALPIAKQIAEALEAAHEAGVIHRDIKPANIKVREDGNVKVLDFGLAKALDPNPEGDPSQSPTLTAAATQMGVIMGTAAYMSPEQAAGRRVDKRADIWSFGVVLFEMLTGQRPFTGETVSHVIGGVLRLDPDWHTLPDDTPPLLRRLLRRCLQKERTHRLRDIGDALTDLDDAATAQPSDEVGATAQAGWRRAVPLIATLLVGGLITGVAVWNLVPEVVRPVARFVVSTPETEPPSPGASSVNFAISPDGSRIVYVVGTFPSVQLYVRSLDQLAGTRLGDGADPFISPDGMWVGFGSTGTGTADQTVQRISITGGPPVTLFEHRAGLRGASWGPNDTIIFASSQPGTGLFRAPAGGGEPVVLTTPDAEQGERAHLWPEFLPDGGSVLFTIVKGAGTQNTEIAVLDLATGQQKSLVAGGSTPRYAPTGHIIYGAEDTLMAVPFDLDRLTVTGAPVPVVEGVTTRLTGAVAYSVSANGSLVYVPRGSVTGLRTLVWVDREGRAEDVGAEPKVYNAPRLSPDGNRVALLVRDGAGNVDIWVHDLARNTSTRLTFDPGLDMYPLWTLDGARVVFSSNRDGGGRSLFWRAADGTGQVDRLTTSPANSQSPWAWLRDGRTLVFQEGIPLSPVWDIHVLSM